MQQQQQQPDEAIVTEKDFANRSRQETTRMCRLLKLLHEYVGDYDCEFQMREERSLLPLGRAHRYARSKKAGFVEFDRHLFFFYAIGASSLL